MSDGQFETLFLFFAKKGVFLYQNNLKMNNYSTIEEIRQAYPNKWVLLGDPKIEATNVLGGFVVFNAETKQGLLEGRDLVKNFKRSTWTFTGEKRRGTRQWVGIFRQVPKNTVEI